MLKTNNNLHSISNKLIDDNLVPPRVDIVLNAEGLLPVSSLSRPVKVTFPAWAAVMAGISYQLLWDDTPVGEIKLIEAGTRPGDTLILHIPVEALTEGKHSLSYQLTNTENGSISEAPSSPIEVDRTPPGSPILGPILFPEQVKDGLTSDELDSLNNVLPGTIAGYQGMEEGDVIRTYWNGIAGPTAVVTKDDMGLRRVVVEFRRPFLEVIGDIEAPVHYTVTDLAGNLSMASEVILVKLKLRVLPPLPAPYVKEASGNVLDPANATAGATVVIDASAKLKVGERVFVVWQGPKGYGEKDLIVTDSQAGKTLEVVFAASLVIDNAGAFADIVYGVYRPDGSMQRSPDVRVDILKNELIFDTSPVTLAGKVYLLPGRPDILPAFGAGTCVQRQASGGQAPYTYTSSNTDVAQVDRNGLTTVRGNGTATISVTDAGGQTQGFEVTVSGVIHCLGLNSGNLTQMIAAAAARGARIPSIDELHEIYATYGNRWPMGNAHYWSSTVAKNLLGAKWYFVKNLVTGQDFKLLHHNASLGVGIR